METDEKEIDKELDDILGEMPLDKKEQKQKSKEQKPEKSSKGPIDYIKSKRKGIIIVIVIIALLLIGTLIFGPLTCDCISQDSNETCENGDQISFSSIKKQIISKGYAEISGEGVTMKVSPYTG